MYDSSYRYMKKKLCVRPACPNASNQHAVSLCSMIIEQLVKPIKLMEIILLPADIHNISRCDLKAVELPIAVLTAHNPGPLLLVWKIAMFPCR